MALFRQSEPLDEPLEIQCRSFHEMLQVSFCEPPIPALAQPVRSYHLGESSFNGRSAFHRFPEGLGLPFFPARFEEGIMTLESQFASILRQSALRFEGTVLTLVPELDFHGSLVFAAFKGSP